MSKTCGKINDLFSSREEVEERHELFVLREKKRYEDEERQETIAVQCTPYGVV